MQRWTYSQTLPRLATSRSALCLFAAVGVWTITGVGSAQTGTSTEMSAAELASLIDQLSEQMHQAAAELHFELAARLRDEISDLKKELRQMSAATR